MVATGSGRTTRTADAQCLPQTILFLATNTSLAKYSGQTVTPSKSAKRCEALATAAFEEVHQAPRRRTFSAVSPDGASCGCSLQASNGKTITQAEFCKFVNRFMKIFKEQGKRHMEDPNDMSAGEKEAYTSAATLIQAMARGRIDRKKVQERNKAISKIQASARGHLTRQDTRRIRDELITSATHAVVMPNPELNYKVTGVEELVEVSAARAKAAGTAPTPMDDAQAHAHTQRLGLVRHALRTMHDDELAEVTKVTTPDVPTLVLAGAVRSRLRGSDIEARLVTQACHSSAWCSRKRPTGRVQPSFLTTGTSATRRHRCNPRTSRWVI